MSQKRIETHHEPAEPETVELVSENGSIAHPLKEDEGVWLAAGWKRVDQEKTIKE